jgi:hypothetical protein
MLVMKNFFINVAVFAAGAGAGYLVAKKYYQKIAEDEIAEMRKYFEQRSERIEKEIEEKLRKKLDSKRKEEPNMLNPHSRPIRDLSSINPYERAKVDYNLFSKVARPEDLEEEFEEDEDNSEDQYDDFEEETSEEDDENEETEDEDDTDVIMSLSDIDRTRPYVINNREYQKEFDHHDKLKLYYYMNDDVLCDEDDRVINDIEGTVGFDSLNNLDVLPTVWVRNEPLCADYEIIGVNESFVEKINGSKGRRALTPREQYLKQQKRRNGNVQDDPE